MVVDPVGRAAARDFVFALFEAGCEFVGDDEILRVAAKRSSVDNEVVGAGRGQRFAQEDAALDGVDFVILRGFQDFALHHQPGDLIALFDADALGAGGDVLTAEIVQRAAGATEYVAGAKRAWLGRKGFGLAALFAVGCRGIGRHMRFGTIEAPVVAHEFRPVDGGLEVAPHDVAVAAFQPHVEFAVGWRIVSYGAVVAINGIVFVRIEVPQQVMRVLAHEVREQMVDRLVARIGGRRQQRVATDLALEVKGEAAIDEGLVVVLIRLVRVEQGEIVTGRAMPDGEIGERDIEPIAVGNAGAAGEFGDVALRIGDFDTDLMRAGREDGAVGECAVAVDRHSRAHDVDLRAQGEMRARDGHSAAGHGDVVDFERVAVIDRRNLCRIRLAATDIGEFQDLGLALIKPSAGVVNAHDIGQAIVAASGHMPVRLAMADGNGGKWLLPGGVALGEHPHFGMIDVGAIVGVDDERGTFAAQGRVGRRDDVEARLGCEAIIADLHVGAVEREIGATLTIGIDAEACATRGHAIDADGEGQPADRSGDAAAVVATVGGGVVFGVDGGRVPAGRGAPRLGHGRLCRQTQHARREGQYQRRPQSHQRPHLCPASHHTHP